MEWQYCYHGGGRIIRQTNSLHKQTLPEFNLSKEDLVVLYDAIDYTGLANAVRVTTVVPKEVGS